MSTLTDEETTLGEDGVERIYCPGLRKVKLSKGLVAAYYNEREKMVSWQLGVGSNQTDLIHCFGPPILEVEVRAMVLRMHDDPNSATELLELEEEEFNWHLLEEPELEEPGGVTPNPSKGVEEVMENDPEEDSLYTYRLRRQRGILQILEPKFSEKIQVWNGHHRNGEYFYSKNSWSSPEKRLRSMFKDSFTIRVDDKDFQRMEEAEKNGTLLDPPVVFEGTREFQCTFCDQYLKFGFDGQRLLVVGDPCPHPEGLTTEWELNVTSGKLAVGNDFRQWFPCPDDQDINTLLGQHLTTLDYAKVGMSHGCVGNTCPRVFQSNDKFVIGSYHSEEAESKPCPWGEEVASICTDLWWYSMVDYDELLKRIAHYTPGTDIDDINLDVVDVRPGVYRFRQVVGVERDNPIVEFTTFEWVRDPDPLMDYLDRERAMDLTAVEVLIEHCLSWPSLYMNLGFEDPREQNQEALILLWETFTEEQKVNCLARAADHIMCVIGGGIEWHENGFPRTSVSEGAKRLAQALSKDGIVPAFKGRTHWYPISAGYGGLCLGAGITNEYTAHEIMDLAPSFVMLGLNICQNAIQYGEEPRLNHEVWPPAYEIPFCRERMKLFGCCYQGLRKKYPDLVFDAGFDRWMQEIDFDKYVEEFNFGPTHPPDEGTRDLPLTTKGGDYFVFDSNLLKDGSFCGHPRYRAGWAKKKDAQRYTLRILAVTLSPMGHIHTEDSSCRGPATIPLRVVGRVIRGTGDGYASKILEVAFDYGTPDMCKQRWGISEDNMIAVRQFSDEKEYQTLLEKCKLEFAEEEAKIEALVTAKEIK